VKRALSAEQIQNPLRPLGNVGQVVDFLQKKYTERVQSAYKRTKVNEAPPFSRVFWHIGKKEVVHTDRSIRCNTLPGSKSLYSIMGFSETDPTLLRTHAMSYFCIPCVDGDWANCVNSSHIQGWDIVRLVPESTSTVAAQIEQMDDESNWVHDGVSLELGDLVLIGDNFMIPVEEDNEDGVDFYILQCTRSKFMLKESLHCPWGGIFAPGDEVIKAKYFKKHGRGDKTYVFCDKAVKAHVDAHLVRACKFPMVLASHRVKDSPVYKMSSNSMRLCEDALQD
jgi:hypothetical protein